MKKDAKTIMKEFREIALREGYTVKVVGDFAYRKPRRKRGKYQYIKLWGAKNGISKITRREQ